MAQQAGAAWKEKLGVSLSPREKQDLTNYSAYKRNSINTLNEYIKSITGAAMTDAEAERLLKGLPKKLPIPGAFFYALGRRF